MDALSIGKFWTFALFYVHLCVATLASFDLMTSKMCPIDQENLAGLGAFEMSKYYYILNENGTKL